MVLGVEEALLEDAEHTQDEALFDGLPPSTGTFAPLMNDESSLARKHTTLAISLT